MARATLLLLALALAGCGGGDGDATAPGTPAGRVLAGAQAQAPPSPTAGTLALVPDGPQARRRLAYANLDALTAAADLPVSRDAVVRRVLGPGVAVGAGTAVRVGASSPERPGEVPPARSAITPAAASAVQSCLGDTLAQTLLGPGAMGADAALGAGLAESGDAPAGVQLRICAAPRLIRHLHDAEEAFARRFGDLGRRAVWGEREIGEREIAFATVAAGALPAGDVLALLAGGPELRALAWR